MFQIACSERLPAGGRIVKGEVYRASLEADQILASARAEAAQIVKTAEDHYQAEKERGYAEGMRNAQTAGAAINLTRIAEANRYFLTVEERLVEVVERVLKKVLGEFDEQELLLRAARHALRWARTQSRVTLRVSAAQADHLRDNLGKLTQNYPAIEIVDIVPDERLTALDCLLETEIGEVEASVETQLAAIKLAFRQAIRSDAATQQREAAQATEATPISEEMP